MRKERGAEQVQVKRLAGQEESRKKVSKINGQTNSMGGSQKALSATMMSQ